ncbi:GNAT family N-acetyltransferase [Caballeronia sp. AZ7_KS35]|uniref:GNAT family N-acetyltransferase n=1 Tax=Caballeronia sp. AZ7_KS35 TaxID=2921762 RepID=UPI0020286E90
MCAASFASFNTKPVEMDNHQTLTFRPARASDAAVCAPLVFASGEHEFEYFLGASPEQCIAFLKREFGGSSGRFSWRRHEVAVDAQGKVVAVLALHDGRRLLADHPRIAWAVLRHFGPMRAVPILLRGLILETELPKPRRTQTLLAHCATASDARGKGAFTALFDYACRARLDCLDAENRELVLDVLVSNPRAMALYRRLGFVPLERRCARSRYLPARLESVHMRLDRANRPASDGEANLI